MINKPTGTVTFLFTDIEGSTKIARSYPKSWEASRARHHEILSSAIGSNNGYVFQIIGDAFCASFHTAGDALRAATKAQIDLHNEQWQDTPIKVRMGIHTGKAELQENGQYQGYLAMSCIQRLMSAGHGGQVLVTAATQELLHDDLPDNASLRDMGKKRLKDLIRLEQIYQLVTEHLPADFPPLKTLESFRHNLPLQLTSFIGREKELEQIEQSIKTHRLVTLTGVGGTGKTRLSLQAAAELLDQFPDGVWFVELASITNPDLILKIILTAIGIPEQPGLSIRQVLMDYLQRKKSLIILDNCEHLLSACSTLVKNLLDQIRDLRILTTSREALGIQGELIWQVPSLSIPDVKQKPSIEQLSQYESVQLFVERAVLAQPQFTVTNDNAPAVTQICFRLDGIPLAIELAAGRVRTLSVEQIAKRLDDRFRLLTGGNRAALERHQTLRATIDWSYNLLSSNEKLLLCRLSIFSGGWTLEAAEQVCVEERGDFDVLDLLTRLVEKSLVNLDGSRYFMLETTRQFAQEKLFASEEGSIAHDRHLSYFLSLASQGNKNFDGPSQIEWMDRFENDIDNFRAALDWCISEQHTESAVNLLADLCSILGWRGYFMEIESWFEKLRALPDIISHPSPYARLLSFVGWHYKDKNIIRARSILEESQRLWLGLGTEGEQGLAQVLGVLGEIALYSDTDTRTAQTFLEHSLELYEKHSDELGVAWSTFQLGSLAAFEGRFTDAEEYYKKSLAKFQELGVKSKTAFVLGSFGEMMRSMGDYDRAGTYWEQNLELFKELRTPSAIAIPFLNLGWISLRKKEFDKARKLFKESLNLFQKFGDENGTPLAVAGLASILGMTGTPDQGAVLFGAAKRIIDKSGYLEPADQKDFDHYLNIIREELDETTFEKAWKTGQTMTVEQVIEYVAEEVDE